MRISPWAAVALAALVAAFCGNAIAGSQATDSASQFTEKKARKLFNRLLNRRAPKLSVARAEHALSADTATTATDAGAVRGLEARELFFAAPANTQPAELFNAGGLSINAVCPAAVTSGPELSATTTGGAQAALRFVGRGFSPGNAIGVDQYQLNAGDPAVDLDSGEDRGAAELSFIREDGVTVTGVISWDDGVRAANDLCGVGGVLIVG